MNKTINSVILFPNYQTMLLYTMELEGQISDGKYENSRPYDHWKWLWHSTVRIANADEIPGYYSVSWAPRLKNYNINEWPKWIVNKDHKFDGYEWAGRVIGYARFGKVLDNMNYTDTEALIRQNGYLSTLIESMMYFLEKNPNGTYADFVGDVTKTASWRVEYIDKCPIMNEDTFNAFKNTEYDIKQLRKDIKIMQNSVNTIIRKKIYPME